MCFERICVWRLIMDARVKFTPGPAEGRTRLPAHDACVCGARLHRQTRSLLNVGATPEP